MACGYGLCAVRDFLSYGLGKSLRRNVESLVSNRTAANLKLVRCGHEPARSDFRRFTQSVRGRVRRIESPDRLHESFTRRCFSPSDFRHPEPRKNEIARPAFATYYRRRRVVLYSTFLLRGKRTRPWQTIVLRFSMLSRFSHGTADVPFPIRTSWVFSVGGVGVQ